MELKDFRALVDRLIADVPEEFLEGVVAVEVSPKTMPDPVRAGVFTMGECIPLDFAGEPIPSRVVLYHGSFRALGRDRAGFDWRAEAWETLTHELRHHLEWRANTAQLERYDWAAEQNFRRHDGESFDPVFYLSGERLAPDLYRVDDDIFWDRVVGGAMPQVVSVAWHGRDYVVRPPGVGLPGFVSLEGLHPVPAGEAVLVLRRRPGVLDLFRRHRPPDMRRARVESPA